jgi:hypothetical protein
MPVNMPSRRHSMFGKRTKAEEEINTQIIIRTLQPLDLDRFFSFF